MSETVSAAPPRSLWHHRDFMFLWAGQTVSEVGSSVTTLALPLLALITLHATTFEVAETEVSEGHWSRRQA